MKIPSFNYCQKKKAGEMNPLEYFIYTYSPTGGEGVFEQDLSNLLRWMASQLSNEAGRADVCKHEKIIAIAHGWMCEKCRVVLEPPAP